MAVVILGAKVRTLFLASGFELYIGLPTVYCVLSNRRKAGAGLEVIFS